MNLYEASEFECVCVCIPVHGMKCQQYEEESHTIELPILSLYTFSSHLPWINSNMPQEFFK